MHIRNHILTGGICCFILVSRITFAAPAVHVIDEFTIQKNGALWFEDSFDDDVAPPSAPNYQGGGTASYAVKGALGPEFNDKLDMDLAQAVPTTSLSGKPASIVQARLKSNIDNADGQRGLKANHTFRVSAVFDLAAPSTLGELFRIRLTDVASGYSDNDRLQLAVKKTATGEKIQFRHTDFSTGVGVTLGEAALDVGHDQVKLILTKQNAGSNEILASYQYIDAGVAWAEMNIAGVGRIFNGETYTRAEFAVRELEGMKSEIVVIDAITPPPSMETSYIAEQYIAISDFEIAGGEQYFLTAPEISFGGGFAVLDGGRMIAGPQ